MDRRFAALFAFAGIVELFACTPSVDLPPYEPMERSPIDPSFSSDGRLDSTFGAGGRASVPENSVPRLLKRPDGTITFHDGSGCRELSTEGTIGDSRPTTCLSREYLDGRYLSDGTLLTLQHVPGGVEGARIDARLEEGPSGGAWGATIMVRATHLVLTSDEKVIVVQAKDPGLFVDQSNVLVRLGRDLKMEPGFGTRLSDRNEGDIVAGIDSAGSIYVGRGRATAAGFDGSFVRTDASGQPESNAGALTRTVFETVDGRDAAGPSVVIPTLIVRSDRFYSMGAAIARYTLDGRFDATFGDGGLYRTPAGFRLENYAFDDDGLWLAGESVDGPVTSGTILHLTSAGKPDRVFGTGGAQTACFGEGYTSFHSVLRLGRRIIVGAREQTGGLTSVLFAGFFSEPDPAGRTASACTEQTKLPDNSPPATPPQPPACTQIGCSFPKGSGTAPTPARPSSCPVHVKHYCWKSGACCPQGNAFFFGGSCYPNAEVVCEGGGCPEWCD